MLQTTDSTHSPLSNLTPGDGGAGTVTLDPSKSDAIQISGAESMSTAASGAHQPTGAVESTIEDIVPKTGVESLDSGMNTFAKSVGGLIDSFIAHLPTVVIAIIVIIFTAFLATFAGKLVRRITKKVRVKQNLQDLFSKFAYIGVWFLGLIAAAGIVFPGLGMGELVATAGLASIAIGFAFQDIFENFLAGVLIIWRFPFDEGDFIELPAQDVMGSVEEVQIRMTHIRAVTGELILVPNAMIYKSVVHVLTNRTVRRQTVICGIAYQEDVAEGRRVITEAVKSCESVDQEKPIQVFAHEFADSSINFEVAWWTGPTPVQQRSSRDEVIEKIKAALDNAGIEIPYPYRTLTFTKNEPDIINAVAGRLPAGGGENES